MQKNLLFLVFLLSLTTIAKAQWDGNPATVNNPVGTTARNEFYVSSVTDGSGGAIVVWSGFGDTDSSFIFAQRKSSTGQVLWTNAATPKQLFKSANSSYIDDVVADGAGGAYISWENYISDSTSDIYIQHINSSGNELFATGGLRLNAPNGLYNSSARLVADGSGLIAAWSTQSPDSIITETSYAQVFIQRFTSSGVPQWTAGGVQACTAAGLRAGATIISDGSNGALMAFSDARNSEINEDGDFDNVDVYAQHISSSGARLWGTDGKVVSNELYNQEVSQFLANNNSIVSDGSGGFIVAYNDFRNDNDGVGVLYAQRINSSGSRVWATQGVKISTSTTLDNILIGLAGDGANGAAIAWNENDNTGTSGTILAQRITGAGALNWGVNGITVNPVSQPVLYNANMAVDANGDYVFCWTFYSFSGTGFVNQAKAQKINNAGAKQWAATGADICTNPLSFPSEPDIVKSDGTNMLVFWVDSRNENNSTDIYAAKLTTTGSLAGTLVTNYTTTANGNWNAPGTWLGNAVPPAGADVIIKHIVSGNLTTTCNSLTVQSPGSLTVNTGISITVLH